MHFQYVVAPPSTAIPAPPQGPGIDGTTELLRHLLEVQREQLAVMRAANESAQNLGRWRAFLARWAEDYPTVGEACVQSVPALERAFVKLLDELTVRVSENENDLENEFGLSEFLDRYGMRLAQLGNVINILGPIAEAAKLSE